MANPTGKLGKSRSRKRKANWKAAVPSINVCPQCHAPKQPHRACPSCGAYAGRQVIVQEDKGKGKAKGKAK